jgi:hypothetical protein
VPASHQTRTAAWIDWCGCLQRRAAVSLSEDAAGRFPNLAGSNFSRAKLWGCGSVTAFDANCSLAWGRHVPDRAALSANADALTWTNNGALLRLALR